QACPDQQGENDDGQHAPPVQPNEMKQHSPFSLEERVDEWRNRRALGQDQDHRKQGEGDQNGREPPALVAPEEREKLTRRTHPLTCSSKKAHSLSKAPAPLQQRCCRLGGGDRPLILP